MKANRKAFNNDEEAVSPVIAVILMVAITVVLAATVFVLVNELGQDVGETGPNLGLSTVGSTTDSDNWDIRITSATQSKALSEYSFILTTVDNGTLKEDWSSSPAQFTTDEDACWELASLTGGSNLAVGERYQLTYEAECDDNTGTFANGQYELEIVHRPTSTSAGSLSREF